MGTIIFNALITLIISTVIGGYFTVYNQHRGKVIDKIWEERYIIYAKLWEISKFVPKYPMIKTVTYNQLYRSEKGFRFFIY